MTQEERQLLIKDLAGRLPYNVVVGCTEDDEPDTFFKCILTAEMLQTIIYKTEYFNYTPFLRPMPSMTEEEEKQLQKIHQDFIADRKYNSYGCARADDGWVSIEDMDTVINFLNAHHFDYRGLIEKGLAIEVTEKNNPY